jgi:hypothetical protein
MPVRAEKLGKVLKVLGEWEPERENQAPDPSFRLRKIISDGLTEGASL